MGYLIRKTTNLRWCWLPQVLPMMCGRLVRVRWCTRSRQKQRLLIVDIYNEILRMLSRPHCRIGLSIMAVGGYARYMERIGASRAMVGLVSCPLKLIRSPYILLSATYVIGQIMARFLTSVLFRVWVFCSMVTLFPTLVSLGVSRLSAVAVIATTMSIEWGILETNSILLPR
ncbi:hypothetical protein ACVXHB_11655 [Escherichia coli]